MLTAKNMQIKEDKEILNLMMAEDTRDLGFRCLMTKYKEKLYWHIRRMVTHHEDTDDVIQNTFIKIYRNIDTFKQESSLFTWVYRIATNESLNFIKSRNLKNTISFDQTSVGEMRSEKHPYFDENQAVIYLQQAIDGLPDKQKLVFNMRYFDEMPYENISEITDTSVGALKASYHHAVKKIEEFVKSKS